MTDRFRFTKMHGAGNDFVVIDGVRQAIEMTPRLARAIADRHRGIGCDQILLVERPDRPGVDFRYRIWNANGGEVEHCGNGARCFVRFVRDRGLTDKAQIAVSTMNGLIRPRMEDDGSVTVDMGAPIFALDRVPFDATGLAPIAVPGDATFALWPLSLMHGKKVAVGVVSMGNPHAVCVVDDVARAPVLEDGPVIEAHPRFPRRVNAGFMQIVDRGRIRLRVYERGVGETLACGTGACAAVVVGIRRGLLDECVRVETHGGELTIRWAGADNPVFMTGPAENIFEGEIDVARLLKSPSADPSA